LNKDLLRKDPFMALNIQTNVSSLEAQRNTMKNQTALTKSFARLSSGYRVN